MSIGRCGPSLALLGALLLATPGAQAALTPAQSCQVKKLKEAAKYVKCRLKAEQKGIKDNLSPDFTACDTKFGSKFPQIVGAVCTTEGDSASVMSRVTGHIEDLVGALMPPLATYACDVLAQNGCASGEACYLVAPSVEPATSACASEGTGGQDTPCTFANDCVAGFGCLLPDVNPGDFLCTAMCDTNGGAPSCGGGLVCRRLNEFYEDVKRVPADVGICVTP